MALSEFELIAAYFATSDIARGGEGVLLGIGDDAAILRPPPGEDLVVSIDTLVAGVHFPLAMSARDLGHRALAVNLSDLAAMGARPLWFTLALTLPAADEAWLDGFTGGMAALARQAGIALIGGDTTRGPLSITVQVHGAVPQGRALRRDGARPGDEVWVSGWPGLAALGLKGMLGEAAPEPAALAAFLGPLPRLALGRGLLDIATAAIDVSDGLLADAAHIAERSGARLELDAGALPLAAALLASVARDAAIRLCLGGGDDYELCFTAPAARADAIQRLAATLALPGTRIGRVVEGEGISCAGAAPDIAGYRHFADSST